jgi:uncharacterized DUF497 family protein
VIDLTGLTGFEWDDGNRDKNRVAHGVLAGECEEAFFNLPLLLYPDPTHSTTEIRYYILGQTNEGRCLFIVFTVRGPNIRVISARDMSRKEREIYGKASS